MIEDTPGYIFMKKIYEAIKHGDEKHQEWLYNELMKFAPLYDDEILVEVKTVDDFNKDRSR